MAGHEGAWLRLAFSFLMLIWIFKNCGDSVIMTQTLATPPIQFSWIRPWLHLVSERDLVPIDHKVSDTLLFDWNCLSTCVPSEL